MGGLLAAIVVCLAVCLILIVRMRGEHEQQRELVARVRQSELYGHLYPELQRSEERMIETIIVRPEQLSIRYLLPVGDVKVCTFDAIGFDPVEQEPLYALAQAIAVDVPQLRDHRDYHFITHTEHKPDGTVWHWYEYGITTDCKDELLRSVTMRNDPVE